MFLLPYGHVHINTRLSKDVAQQKLAQHLEPRRFLYGMFRGEHKFFEGSLSDGQFEINRIVASRNTFNPFLIGKFQSTPDSTIIDISVQFQFPLLIPVIVAFLAVLFFSLCLPLQFVRLSELSIASLGHFLVNALKWPAIVYLAVILFFNVEAYKSLKFLDDLFVSK